MTYFHSDRTLRRFICTYCFAYFIINALTVRADEYPQAFVQFGCKACVEAHDVLSTRTDIYYRFVVPDDSLEKDAATYLICIRNSDPSLFSALFPKILPLYGESLAHDNIKRKIRELNGDVSQFDRCLENRLSRQKLEADQLAWRIYSFKGTPAYVYKNEVGDIVRYEGAIKSSSINE